MPTGRWHARGYRAKRMMTGMSVIVLTGAGDKAFCRRRPVEQRRCLCDGFSRSNVNYADLLRLSQNATKPAIARVGGVCMAGGMVAVHDRHGGRRRSCEIGLPSEGRQPMQVLSLLQSTHQGGW